jgi:hypothetical protein
MAMGHAGETAFHWAVKEGGAGGGAGAVLGALLGWPHAVTERIGTVGLTHWHNAFTSSPDLTKVVEAGLFGGGVVAVAIGVGAAWAFGKKS